MKNGKPQFLKLLASLVALTGLFLIWKSNTTDTMDGVQSQPIPKEERTQKLKTHPAEPITPSSAQAPIAGAESKEGEDEKLPSFSFEKEVAEVNSMVAQFPGSRPRLIQFINRPDFFKEKNREIKPHTLTELTQMKMGAVKVMALRELMKSERDLQQLSLDLQMVAQTAQDPTIRNIAQAAGESLAKGRSFFDDFLDGIERMPLDN